MKNKIGKQVWLDGKLWDVVKTISPTKFDHYILVQRIRKDQIHEDSKTHPVEMALIDCGNDKFYPNIERVRKIIEQLEKDKTERKELEEELGDIWLNVVRK